MITYAKYIHIYLCTFKRIRLLSTSEAYHLVLHRWTETLYFRHEVPKQLATICFCQKTPRVGNSGLELQKNPRARSLKWGPPIKNVRVMADKEYRFLFLFFFFFSFRSLPNLLTNIDRRREGRRTSLTIRFLLGGGRMEKARSLVPSLTS